MKIKYTKVIALIATVVFTMGFAACGKKEAASTNASGGNKTAVETKVDKSDRSHVVL